MSWLRPSLRLENGGLWPRDNAGPVAQWSLTPQHACWLQRCCCPRLTLRARSALDLHVCRIDRLTRTWYWRATPRTTRPCCASIMERVHAQARTDTQVASGQRDRKARFSHSPGSNLARALSLELACSRIEAHLRVCAIDLARVRRHVLARASEAQARPTTRDPLPPAFPWPPGAA